MEIVIPITGFGRQGGFRVLSNLANEWIRLGHTVLFLSPRESDDPYFPTTAEIIWLDRRGIEVPEKDRRNYSGRLRIWNALRSLVASFSGAAKRTQVLLRAGL